MNRYLILGCVGLALALGGAGWLLKNAWAENGRLEGDIADRDATIKQKDEDAELSAHIIEKQQAALSDLDRKVGSAIQEVYRVPTSNSCAQSAPMRAATRSLRSLFDGGGAPPAGREPAAAVR